MILAFLDPTQCFQQLWCCNRRDGQLADERKANASKRPSFLMQVIGFCYVSEPLRVGFQLRPMLPWSFGAIFERWRRFLKEERALLNRAIGELGAIGRNLNQIARAANQGAPVVGPTRAELMALLRACEALRNHVRGLMEANLRMWGARLSVRAG